MNRDLTEETSIEGMIDVHNIEEGCEMFEVGNCYHPESPYDGVCAGIEDCPWKVNKSSKGPWA